VAINSNDPQRYPEDSPAKMVREAAAAGYTFPYLHDATQEVAKAYRAACTPDFYLFDREQRLVYGQFDDSRPEQLARHGRDLRAAVEAVLAGRPAPPSRSPALAATSSGAGQRTGLFLGLDHLT